MIAYIFKSCLILLILYGLYWFLLRKEKLFVFNRYFLILSVVFSLIVPFVNIPVNVQESQNLRKIITTIENSIPYINSVQNVAIQDINSKPSIDEAKSSGLDTSTILMIIYISGVLLFLIRFLKNIYSIFRQIKLSEKISFNRYNLVLTNEKENLYCFFNYIFINKEDYKNLRIDVQLLSHELEHVTQYHSIDIVLIELIKVFYWFNPVYLLFDRAIRINHEYLADHSVIQDEHDVKNYSEKLLSFIFFRSNISLTSGSNRSFIKKRLLMITKSRSNSIYYGFRITIALCIMFLLFLFISFRMPQESNDAIFNESDSSSSNQHFISYSGTWNLDLSRSAALPGIVSETLFITQKGNGITINRIIITEETKPLKSTFYYTIGARKESKSKSGKTVITSFWDTAKHSFSIIDEFTAKQNGAKLVSKRISIYSINDSGNTLTIDSYDTLPGVSLTSESQKRMRMIYSKVIESFIVKNDQKDTSIQDIKTNSNNISLSKAQVIINGKVSNSIINKIYPEKSNTQDTINPYFYHADSLNYKNNIITLKGNGIIKIPKAGNSYYYVIKSDSSSFEIDKNIISAYNGTWETYNSVDPNPQESFSFEELKYDLTTQKGLIKKINASDLDYNYNIGKK